MKQNWAGEKLTNLLVKKHKWLMEQYGLNYGTVANLKHKYKLELINELNQIRIAEMEKERPDQDKLDRIGKLAELLEQNNITPEAIRQIDSVRVGTYEMCTKNAEGEAEIHELHVANVTYTPQNTPERDFVRQAPVSRIYPAKSHAKKGKEKTALIVTDLQGGFRQYPDGSLDPLHDEKAIAVTMEIAKDTQPDQVIFLGDSVDLANMGRFNQELAFHQTSQATIDWLNKRLAEFRATCPNSKITVLSGNHEQRWQKYIKQNAAQIYGIKQANIESELSVLDLPFLLRLNELGIDYVDAYPTGKYWINDRLKAIHGNMAKQIGRTAATMVTKEDTSTIAGHNHRYEMATRTIPGRNAGRLIIAATFGTLGRLDGAIPSYHSGTDAREKVVPNIEQWQQGAGFIEYTEGDHPFNITPIIINTFDKYYTRFNGKTYENKD